MKSEILHLLLLGDSVSAAQQYAADVLATGPIAYWRLDEGSGATIVDSSGNGYNGSYTGITWDGTQAPQGTAAPFWDGTNDYGNVHSAGLSSAFNLDEFTVMLWIKVNSAAVWTDGITRDALRFQRDASNYIEAFRPASNNHLWFRRNGAGTLKTVQASGLSSADFFSVIMTASVAGGGLLAAGEFEAYIDGVQAGTTQTGNIASTGSGLSASTTLLGAVNTAPSNVWHGYIAHAVVWDRPVDNDILALATV